METYLLYWPLWTFIVLLVSTPGPANLLLMSAGASYGFRASLRFLAGLVLGKLGLNILISLGLGTLLLAFPLIKTVLSVGSVGYMSYLALRGWNQIGTGGEAARLGFVQGLFVHPLSPKTWAMATLAVSNFATNFTSVFEVYFLIPLSFMAAQIVFHILWCLCGAVFRKQLGGNLILNRALILMTIAVVVWALFQ